MSELRKINRALISVSDKDGIVELAKKLSEFGVEIISNRRHGAGFARSKFNRDGRFRHHRFP